MRIRLYMDEVALSIALIKAFRSHGIEVVTASDANMAGAEDEQHIKYATSQDLALYSYNIKDYTALHTAILT